MTKNLFIFVFLLTFNNFYAQEIKNLNNLNDEELLSLFDKVSHDSIQAEKVARFYLDRARKEKDTIKMARGYDRLASIFNSQKNIQS